MLSIPFRMLLPQQRRSNLVWYIFQFLLGCYKLTKERLEEYNEWRFQFLLGCYRLNHFTECLDIVDFQFLLGCYYAPDGKSAGIVAGFQFLLGCYAVSRLLRPARLHCLSIPFRMLQLASHVSA